MPKQKIDVTRLIEELGDAKKTGLPHMSELAEAFVREAGGTEALAHLLLTEFKNAPGGSLVRAQLFGMIQKIWRYATDQLKVEDPESLADDELDQEIKRVVLELIRDGAIQDAAPDQPEDRDPAEAPNRGAHPAIGLAAATPAAHV